MTILSNLQTISAHNILGQFGLKSCQKKRDFMNHKIMKGFSWKLQDFSES